MYNLIVCLKDWKISEKPPSSGISETLKTIPGFQGSFDTLTNSFSLSMNLFSQPSDIQVLAFAIFVNDEPMSVSKYVNYDGADR